MFLIHYLRPQDSLRRAVTQADAQTDPFTKGGCWLRVHTPSKLVCTLNLRLMALHLDSNPSMVPSNSEKAESSYSWATWDSVC